MSVPVFNTGNKKGSLKMTFGDLWHSNGTIDRGAYALVGVLGFAVKHNIDRFVASYGFHRPWGLFNYWVPVRDVARVTDLRGHEAIFLGTMVALSLPFEWRNAARRYDVVPARVVAGCVLAGVVRSHYSQDSLARP
jgi:hypothetical protein